MTVVWILLAALAAANAAAFAVYMFLRRDPARAAPAVITSLRNDTATDSSGAVRSLQAADLLLPAETLAKFWSPMNLERLARTYWCFLSRATFGLVRVRYSEHERSVVLLSKRVRLLTFRPPEYEMDPERGIVRWRIERGLLVARRGCGGQGYLQIDVRRCAGERPGLARLHVEIEVANFYPAIAAGIGRWFYNQTQSRLHVIVTYAFLRSLARLQLQESRVKRLATPGLTPADVPDPPAEDEHAARVGSSH
jgi:hypothetical protein